MALVMTTFASCSKYSDTGLLLNAGEPLVDSWEVNPSILETKTGSNEFGRTHVMNITSSKVTPDSTYAVLEDKGGDTTKTIIISGKNSQVATALLNFKVIYKKDTILFTEGTVDVKQMSNGYAVNISARDASRQSLIICKWLIKNTPENP